MYFHVAPAHYSPGSDLLCWDELEARGEMPTWKYDGEPVDTDVVCLFETLADVQDFKETFLPDGIVLSVDLSDADDVTVIRVSEGYPAVVRRIPAHYIKAVR